MSTSGAVIIGAACLVWWKGGLVLEVQKPEKWRCDDTGQVHIGVGCVGGGLIDDETPIEALQREAMEEMGCRIELQDAPVTYAVTPDCQVHAEQCQMPGIRPVFTWEACLPGMTPGIRVAVFRGRPAGEPIPGDLPALLCVTPEILLKIGRDGMCVGEALKRGADLRARVMVPEKAWLELVGTPAVLSLLHARGEEVVEVLLEEEKAQLGGRSANAPTGRRRGCW